MGLLIRAAVFACCLAVTAFAQKDTYSGIARVVAVGDVHGDFSALKESLALCGVIDASGKWSGGKTHLVQVGDVPDRGPDTKAIVEYLMDLEKQAKRAGGMVHVLIGNHDAMNVYGDLRYVTPAEFAAFATPDSERVRKEFLDAMVERDKPVNVESYRATLEVNTPPGWVEHRRAWTLPDGAFGRWTVSHNAVLKIDDTLFVHAGISPRVTAMRIGDINKTIRRELSNADKLQGGLAMTDDGPLWYRGLATEIGEKIEEQVGDLLSAYGVSRVVIGHTPTKAPIAARFGGKVIDVDTGMSRAFGGPKDCLTIEGGALFTHATGTKTPIGEAP